MIWCIEDDDSIREIELYALNSLGFEARGFCDVVEFWEALEQDIPELILLDIMLPNSDGLEILTTLKSTVQYEDIPVIMATAKGQEIDIVKALELGADDYLVKPFGMMEMVSRIKSVLRRYKKQAKTSVYQFEQLQLDVEKRTVTIEDVPINLTFKEFEMLKLFLVQPEYVLTRDMIFQQVWKEDYLLDSRTIDMHIRTLRKKLNDYGQNIVTIRNVGYKWEGRDDKYNI